MLNTANYKRGDIPGSTLPPETWFHFGLTWPGPGSNFTTFINGNYQTTSYDGKHASRSFIIFSL